MTNMKGKKDRYQTPSRDRHKSEAGSTHVQKCRKRSQSPGDKKRKGEKRVEVNLNHLRKDLDMKHHKVAALLDKKTFPSPTEIKTLGIEIVECLITRKVIKKEDLLNLDFEVATTPKRPCSAGRGTPQSSPTDSKRRAKSQTRLSRHDGYYQNQDDLKTCLRFEDDDRDPKPEHRGSDAKDVNTQLYIENGELKKEVQDLRLKIENDSREKKQLENHIRVLDKEIERLNLNEKRSQRDVQNAVSLKVHIDQCRSERNEARENQKKLVEDFKQYKEKCEHKIICMQYEKQKAEEKVKSLISWQFERDDAEEKIKSLQNDATYLRNKLEEQEESLMAMTESVETYKRANDNQQKYILELQNRASKQDDEVVKDAKTAIVHYTAETKKYKELSEKAKSDNHRLKMEKEELQTLVQKLRTISKEEKEKNENEIDSYNIKIKTLEHNKKEMVKTLEKQTAELSLLKNKWKNMKDTRDQQDMKRHEQDCIKLKQENEALEDKLGNAEDQHAAEIRQHIESEKKLKNEMIRYRNERNRQQEKVKSLETEVDNMSSKLKEHQVLSTLEKEKLQSSIKRLRNQLDYTETYQNNEISCRASDYQKEELDKKNEELVKLTRKLFLVEEELESCRGRMAALEVKAEEQTQIILRLSAEDRTSSAKRLSDIEKENWSLKRELTEAVKSLDGDRNLKDRYDRDCNRLKEEIERLKRVEKEKDSLEIDNDRLKDQINQLQIRWDKLKSDRLQEKEIAQEVMNLKEQKFKLENDKLLLRQEILSLQEKVKTADEYRHSNEVLRSEIVSLNATINGLKSDIKLMEDKCKSETTARMTRDDLSSKYKEDCDRLRKERNTAQHELVKVNREREELANRLRSETESLKLEVDKTRNEKSELGVLYKAQLNKDAEKIKQLEKQNEILQKRSRSEDTVSQQQAYELLQLKNDYEACKVQKAQLAEELKDMKDENEELETQLKTAEDHECTQCPMLKREIESLKRKLNEQSSRLDEIKSRKCESCDELNHKLKRTEGELEDIQRRLTREENRKCLKCDENERKLSQAKQDNLDLQEKFNVAKTNAQNTGRDVHDMREQIESERSNIKSLQRKVESLEREKTTGEMFLRDKESELSQVRGELSSLDRRITNLQDENGDLQRRCKSREEALVKMDSDIRQLKKENSQLQSDMIVVKQEKETLVSKLEIERVDKLELQERLRNKSSPVVSDQRSCQNCWKYRNEISDLRRELEEMRDRLSEAAGNKLRDNNPNIADLSDMNRPTSLAEKFSSLYTDEYTDAMESIEDDMDEPTAVEVMLSWLKQCFDWCEKLAKEQRKNLTEESIGFMRQYHKLNTDAVVSDRCLIHVKEFQKKIALDSLSAVDQICHAKSITEKKFKTDQQIIKYIKRCTELCWMMQIADPPLYLKFDVAQDENLDKNIYNVFTKSGSKIAYLVWPILYLHKNGPMLGKGVAQGR